jgi:hypothetical protein
VGLSAGRLHERARNVHESRWFLSTVNHGASHPGRVPRWIARLKKDGLLRDWGPVAGSRILVREPSTHHALTVQQLNRWMDGVTTSPAAGQGEAGARILRSLEYYK